MINNPQTLAKLKALAKPVTLEEAREQLLKRLLAGEALDCPCCEQRCQIYRRKLNSGMAVCLLVLFKASPHLSNLEGWIHVPEFLANHALREDVKMALTNREWAKLVFWGLLEEAPDVVVEKMFDGAKSTGFWRVTEAGRAFVRRLTSVSKYILLYNGEFLGFDGSSISIDQALGDKFNYNELMKG